MYLHIGRNQMLAERRIIGIFDLEITSQSKTTRAFLDRAIVYLSELSSQTLQKRMEEPT